MPRPCALQTWGSGREGPFASVEPSARQSRPFGRNRQFNSELVCVSEACLDLHKLFFP